MTQRQTAANPNTFSNFLKTLLQAGSNVSRDCGKCCQRLSVSFSSASFQRISAPSAGGAKGGTKRPGGNGAVSGEAQRRAAKRDALASALDKLQVGQPLPGKGTCKHYGHSHRRAPLTCAVICCDLATCVLQSSQYSYVP